MSSSVCPPSAHPFNVSCNNWKDFRSFSVSVCVGAGSSVYLFVSTMVQDSRRCSGRPAFVSRPSHRDRHSPVQRLLHQFLLLSIIFIAVASGNKADFLERHTLKNAISMGAICADHTPAIYYINQRSNETRWVVFFESGGVCSDDKQCIERYRDTMHLMSSAPYPPTVIGHDILSPDPSESPFAGFNRVLIPYCSGDLFLGRSVPESGTKFNASDTSTYAFTGRFIATGIMQELGGLTNSSLSLLGLAHATEVVIAGSSAGGIGALNIVRYIRSSHIVPADAMLSALIDSSWFIDFYGQGRKLFSEYMVQRTKLLVGSRACKKTDGASPCCLSCSCLVERILRDKDAGNSVPVKPTQSASFITINATSVNGSVNGMGLGGTSTAIFAQLVGNQTSPPQPVPAQSADNGINVMLLVSRYDIFILGRALQQMKVDGRLGGPKADVGTVVAGATEAIDNYAGTMSSSLSRSRYSNLKFSYVQTSCSQHLYFAASSLWTGDGVLAGMYCYTPHSIASRMNTFVCGLVLVRIEVLMCSYLLVFMG